MIKFLVDENVGISVVGWLKSEGYDVISAEESLRSLKDRAILSKAVEEERIIITNDKDFGELVFNFNLSHKGIILLRLKDESSRNKIRVISQLLDKYNKQIPNSFIVATEDKIRIRLQD